MIPTWSVSWRRYRALLAVVAAPLVIAAGVLVATLPAAAATTAQAAPVAAAASGCGLKADYLTVSPSGREYWTNVCGVGFHVIPANPATTFEGTALKVREVSSGPLHRIWLHSFLGDAWCTRSSSDVTVPSWMSSEVIYIQISANTSNC